MLCTVVAFALFEFTQATQYNYCCATSQALKACVFVDRQPISDNHGCATMSWVGGTVPSFAKDEYISLVETTDSQEVAITVKSVQNDESRTLQFAFGFPGNWANFEQSQMSQKFVFKVGLGRRGVGFHLGSGTPDWAVDVMSSPMDFAPAKCEDGVVAVCPLDPIFSHKTYRVGSVENTAPACESKGSWEVPRTEMKVNMKECPTVDTVINGSLMRRRVKLHPVRTKWDILQVNRSSIPNTVICDCIFEASSIQSVRYSDDGKTAEVKTYEAEAGNITLNVTRVVGTQGTYEFILHASTTLDNISMRDCEADAVEGTDVLGNKMPLLKTIDGTAKVATEWEASDLDLLDLPGTTYEFVKYALKPTTRRVERHQFLTMQAFTAGEDFVDFTCTIAACAQRETAQSKKRCEVRRLTRTWNYFLTDGSRHLSDRLLQADVGDEEILTTLPDDCTGHPVPGTKGCDCPPNQLSSTCATLNHSDPRQRNRTTPVPATPKPITDGATRTASTFVIAIAVVLMAAFPQ